MLEALEGPVYTRTQLKGRPLIALLARLNEYKLHGALASSYAPIRYYIGDGR